jgi:DNA-binding transcriptional regulator LsrR (DeoR family)
MGRTVMSIVQAFHHERESWGKFRRALGRSDREAFDRLFQHARQHAAEASYAARPTPFETVVMAVLLEHEKALRDIRERLDKLEAGRLERLVPSGVEGLEAAIHRERDEDPGLAF